MAAPFITWKFFDEGGIWMDRIDLHIHTICSDGYFSPKQVVDEACKNGVKLMAIADHDTIQAYDEALFAYAKSKNIKLIPAVEISTRAGKARIHVLGYGIDWRSGPLKDRLETLRNSRHEYLHRVGEKLDELGYRLDVAALDRIEAVTKAHIARNIIEDDRNKERLMADFRHIPGQGEFIETIMNEGCPAYVKKTTATPTEAADMIRGAGGKVVLAHPVAYTYEAGLSDGQIVKLAKEMKTDGIEAEYLYVTKEKTLVDERAKWRKMAKKHGWFVTIGSDFHFKDNIHPPVGLGNHITGSEDLSFYEKLFSA